MVTTIEKPRILSNLEENILTVLLSKELYGLQIRRAIEESSPVNYSVGAGSLYPVLKKLEDNGYIQASWKTKEGEKTENTPAKLGGRKKYYIITPKGSKILVENRSTRENLLNWQPV